MNYQVSHQDFEIRSAHIYIHPRRRPPMPPSHPLDGNILLAISSIVPMTCCADVPRNLDELWISRSYNPCICSALIPAEDDNGMRRLRRRPPSWLHIFSCYPSATTNRFIHEKQVSFTPRHVLGEGRRRRGEELELVLVYSIILFFACGIYKS